MRFFSNCLTSSKRKHPFQTREAIGNQNCVNGFGDICRVRAKDSANAYGDVLARTFAASGGSRSATSIVLPIMAKGLPAKPVSRGRCESR